MEDMQTQINAILENPDMMKQIMAMAQSLNQQPPQEQPDKHNSNESPIPDIDISMIQKISGLAGQTGIDKNQRTLLSALSPYLSRDRIAKLEKAMRAAKMANMASGFLGNSGLQLSRGR